MHLQRFAIDWKGKKERVTNLFPVGSNSASGALSCWVSSLLAPQIISCAEKRGWSKSEEDFLSQMHSEVILISKKIETWKEQICH